MIKKISIEILSLIVLFGVYVCTFAAPINIVKSAFAKFPKVIAKIVHDEIVAVSSIDRLLNAKISVDFTGYESATAKLVYYLNGDQSTKQEEPVNEGKKINNKQDFYISLPQFSDTDTSVSYQIKIALKDAAGNTFYAYWPSSDTAKFNTSQITSIASKVIGTDGGIVELESGNQEIGNSAITVQPGTFTSDIKVIIEEFDPNDELFLSAGKAKSVQERVRAYSIRTEPAIDTFKLPLSVQLSNATQLNIQKFELKYRKDNSTTWNKAEKIKIDNIDTVQKLLFATVTKTGQYMIFAASNLTDNDYRPENRVRVKSRISAYGGFKFNNLKDGDSVKIYTTSGKKIAELTAGDYEGFEWKGRKGTNNSGDWAESGTYIYQIKVNGKVISGTIAFVW
ncbi:MAG: hypothetical protein IKN42_06770 [Elusimicrobia bacterium]|nr:hypothetical protein [Elusimicrobiota bacterium]